MSKKRKDPRSREREAAGVKSRAGRRDPLAAVAAGGLVLAFLGVGLAVDTGAAAAFDAPKRLTSLFFISIAAAALAFSGWGNPLRGGPLSSMRRWALLLSGGALGWALLSALLSPRSAAALDSVRVLSLYALLLPIGASRVFERSKGLLLGAFSGVLAINAVISILQARGLYQPLALQTEAGSRESTGAYVGNVGYLAVALALAAVAALGVLACARRPILRAAAGGGALLFFGGLLVNRNLTSLSALLAGAMILSVALFGRRALLPAAAVALVLALGIVAYRPMRDRVAGAIDATRTGDWDRLLTYRLGPWKAAAIMAAEKPLIGFGPGTFGAEFVTHRLKAEISSARRYVNPLLASSYAETHCDYLQPFAEAGIPTGLALLAALLFLFRGLAGTARRAQGPRRAEAIFLLAFLGTGAAAAITWFPMQRPISAIPLLLAAGRAWRISGEQRGDTVREKAEQSHTPPRSRGSVPLLVGRGAAAILAIAWAFAPELPRYRAERALRFGEMYLRKVITSPAGEITNPSSLLSGIAALAVDAGAGLPGDVRPWNLAGGARLVNGQPDLAIEDYREGLARGERAETDLNLGRAYEALGDRGRAHAAFLRAVWVSPPLLSAVLPDIAAPLAEQLARLEAELKTGHLKAPPPLPN